MLYLLNKLEIDVMQANELGQAMELAHLYRMPAIIVHQDLAAEAALQRARRQTRCKIITPVNWPKGDKFGVTKLHNTPLNALSQDGFEIMLSPRGIDELRREMVEITRFVRQYLPLASEIRFVLGALTYERDQILPMCEALTSIPAPSLIRTDTNLRIQQVKANPNSHNDLLTAVRGVMSFPLKLSGNIGTTKMMALCKADRYAVSLKQAQAIIKEITENPQKVEKLFASPDDVETEVEAEA